MINWLITMFTEWLMVVYYLHLFPNTNIRNLYNVFRLDIFLFLSFDNISQSRYHTRRQSFLGATQNRPLLILIRYSSVDSTEQTNPEKCNRHTQQIINLATQLAVKDCSNQNVWCDSSTLQAIFDYKFSTHPRREGTITMIVLVLKFQLSLF